MTDIAGALWRGWPRIIHRIVINIHGGGRRAFRLRRRCDAFTGRIFVWELLIWRVSVGELVVILMITSRRLRVGRLWLLFWRLFIE